jgi:hypothetical protein
MRSKSVPKYKLRFHLNQEELRVYSHRFAKFRYRHVLFVDSAYGRHTNVRQRFDSNSDNLSLRANFNAEFAYELNLPHIFWTSFLFTIKYKS